MDRPWIQLETTARGIADMSIRGAGRIGRSASEALCAFAAEWEGDDPRSFVHDLSRAARRLHSTRPTAVSLRNGILLTLKGAENGRTVEEIRDHIVSRSRAFINKAENSVRRIASFAKERVGPGSVVMTHCNSNAALSAIEAAYADGRVDSVICTESRPWRQGHITSRRLASGGIPVTMVVDSAIGLKMSTADAVIVGADTITSEGTLYNKIGTYLVALAAKDEGVPFYVCAETFKFSKESLLGRSVEIEERSPQEVADPLRVEDFPGVRFSNPVFDSTPARLITSIVTEDGFISPLDSPGVIRKMFGDHDKEEFIWL